MQDDANAAALVLRPITLSAAFAERRFGGATQLHQMTRGHGAIAAHAREGLDGVRAAGRGRLLVCVAVPAHMDWLGIPLLPRTEHVLTYLTAALANPGNRVWMIIPLLIIFYAGELVWGERDARMGEISGAAPVPDWVFFVGKFLALAVVLVAWMLVLGITGVIGQAVLGYSNFEIGVYAKVLLGLQLTDYLLFALLALTVHTVVNQKHLGTLTALVIYGVDRLRAGLGIEHKLLVFGASPDWTYSDIRGFGASLQPWCRVQGLLDRVGRVAGGACATCVGARPRVGRARAAEAGTRAPDAPHGDHRRVGVASRCWAWARASSTTPTSLNEYLSARIRNRRAEYERRYRQ